MNGQSTGETERTREMRIYLGKCGRSDLRKARQTAPSHVFGHCWTPQNVGLETVPFFVDNGEFVANKNDDEWSSGEWLDLLDRLSEFSYKPDFIVLPDAYDDAEATIQRHREWAGEVLKRGLDPAFVLQPGLPERMQIRLADQLSAKFVFVGGADRWTRALGPEIVELAHDRGLKVHIGSPPGGPNALAWSYRIGADSADTSSVTASQSWNWLENLEKASLNKGYLKKDSRQITLADSGDESSTENQQEGKSR